MQKFTTFFEKKSDGLLLENNINLHREAREKRSDVKVEKFEPRRTKILLQTN